MSNAGSPMRWQAAVACLVILSGCERAAVSAPPESGDGSTDTSLAGGRLAVLRGGSQNQGFAQALAPRAFDFPADFGPHRDFRHEWWYLTGQLHARSGEDFGFELTFFRLGLAPGAATFGPGVSRWRSHQIYAAHFAITDLAARRFKFAQRYAREALGIAGAQASPFRVWLDDWSLSEDGTRDSPALPAWVLRAQDADDSITLHARALMAPVLNGDRGLSVKADEAGAASYYYSIPHLTVAGQLVRGGRSFEVEGSAWLDREWGSGGLGSREVGWDWFALNLADGGAFMFYALRDRDGNRDGHSAGTWIAPDGSARALVSSDVRIDVLDEWTSPRGGRYPARWRVSIAPLKVTLEVTPLLADQELDTRPRYWEGAVRVAGKPGGRGYVELVGYAR